MLTVKNLTIPLSDIFPFDRDFKTTQNCFIVTLDIENAVCEANNSSYFVFFPAYKVDFPDELI